MEDFRAEELPDWFGHTTVHPVGLALLAALAVAMLVVPRRWAFAPMILLACSVSSAQRVVVAGLDFDFLRILIIVGFLRLLVRGELARLAWNGVDSCVVLFAVVGATAYSMLHDDSAGLINRLGWAFDILGFYFLFRFLFHGMGDPKRVAQTIAAASVPVAVLFGIEYATHRNLFSVFGGVDEFSWIRDGRLRCVGPFMHPIIAGVFWASMLPIVVSLWWSGGRWRLWALVGTAATLFIVFATNSSTPVMAVVFGTAAMCAYPLRKSMGKVMLVAACLLVALHVCMKAPVWHLLARATVFDASTGWHRFFVIDQSLRHFGEWWMYGTKNVDAWNIESNDITNEYVWVGIEGGAFALAAFLAMIWRSFRAVGAERRRVESDPAACRLTWAIGCALFVHCTNFIAVSYFGQSRMIWYLIVALAASQAPAVAAIRAPAAFARLSSTRTRLSTGTAQSGASESA